MKTKPEMFQSTIHIRTTKLSLRKDDADDAGATEVQLYADIRVQNHPAQSRRLTDRIERLSYVSNKYISLSKKWWQLNWIGNKIWGWNGKWQKFWFYNDRHPDSSSPPLHHQLQKKRRWLLMYYSFMYPLKNCSINYFLSLESKPTV